MKFKITITTFLSVFLLISGCKDKKTSSISTNDFLEQKTLTAERIKTNETLNIKNLTIQDSFLLINNSRKDSLFMIYNLKTGNCIKSWGIRGRGPGEYGLFTHLLKVSPKKFQIADFSRYKIETYNIPKFEEESKSNILENYQSNDNREIPQNIATSDGYRYFYDNLFRNKLTLNKWDFGNDPIEINNFNHCTSLLKSPKLSIGCLAINTKANKIVYAYQFSRRFDIFNAQGTREKTIEVNPGSSSNLIEKHIDRKNLEMCYIGAKTFKDSFYLLFIGHSPKDIEKNKFLIPCYIEEYDWNGNPLNLYRVDRFISDFDIYKNNNKSKSFIGVDIRDEHPLLLLN